jgi:TonB-dependent receptor
MTTMVRGAMAVLLLVAAAASLNAQSTATGQVTGRVVDSERGAPLPGARVSVEGTVLTAATDRAGDFRLVGVPVGARTVVISFLGRADESVQVSVAEGQAAVLNVRLANMRVVSEVVTVAGESETEGQARALNQQRTALSITNIVSSDQIGSFPDPNAAEAASRIPGVSIARDQGEGRYVLIRGTEARLNSMMIDGERIPAPEGDTRQVALDSVPADQLQSIEVSKALTPDMDADAIGGAVNLITRTASERLTALFTAAAGYNALQRSYDQQQFSGVLGGRVSQGRIGLLASFSGSSLTRGSENFEPAYEGGYLDDLQLRDYQVDRSRYGLNLSSDIRLSGNDSLIVRGIFNEFKDYEVNNRIRYRPSDRRIEHVLKNRQQDQHVRSVQAGGNHVLGGGQQTFLDYRVAWSTAGEFQPDRLDTIFRQTGVDFAPNVSPDFIDPDNIQPNPSKNNPEVARLNAWETERFETTDRDIAASFNVRTPLAFSENRASFLKFGGKIRSKRKERTFEIGEAGPEGVVLFPQLQDTGFDNSRFLEYQPAGYEPFPGINADASRAMFNALPAGAYEVNPEGDASAYDATERVYAGYAMAEWYLGSNMTLVPGVRVESTTVNYTGNEVLYNVNGDYESTSPVSGSDTYTFVLPGAHLRYALSDQTNLRAAYTRTLARPNYYDLVPYQLVIQEDNEIERGNSSLKPTSSNNLDLLFEHYFRSVGVVSAGVFYKRMSDYIYTFRVREEAYDDIYTVTQPRNGDDASLWGAEFNLQNRLTFLPGPLDGLGVFVNYTLTDSSATFPDRSGSATLPGQSAHLGNVSFWYEKKGFMGKASWNLHGRYVDEVGGEAAEDVYYDSHMQLDVNLSQQVHPRLQVYADFLNLTNAPLRYYIGTADRPIQEEYYKGWSSFGVRMTW